MKRRIFAFAVIAIVALVPIASQGASGYVLVAEGPSTYAEIDCCGTGDFLRISGYEGPGVLTYFDGFGRVRAVTAPFACVQVRDYGENIVDSRYDVGCGRAFVDVAPDLSTATVSGTVPSVMYTEDGSFAESPVISSINFSVTWTAHEDCEIVIAGVCIGPGIDERGLRYAYASGFATSSAMGKTISGTSFSHQEIFQRCCVIGSSLWPNVDPLDLIFGGG